jgi:small subunit ribosomal protein S28e
MADNNEQVQTQNHVEHTEKHFDGFIAEIVDIVGRTGIYGEALQIMCKILEGNDKGRVIRRNAVGREKIGDKIRLPDTTREMKQIKAK